MDGKSPDIAQEKIQQLKTLFPEVFSEGKIDFQRLQATLGQEVIAHGEHYQLTWAGKSSAKKEIQQQSTATLLPPNGVPLAPRPAHILIEGENLEVLRVLQKSYFGKIKTIYIDPPYNTGNDSFVYPDNYSEKKEAYQKRTGIKNESGFLNKQDLWKKNSKENGQFHSVWLSMMYPRLYLARNLLRDDGAIFVSIDDNEAHTLKLLCDEIFGEENFVGEFIWINRTTPNDAAIGFAPDHEFIFVYAKNKTLCRFKGKEKDLANYKNPDKDPNGDWIADNPSAASGNESYRFPIVNPYTHETYYPPKGRFWAFSPKRIEEWAQSGKLVFPKEKGKNFLLKKYKHELKSNFKPISSVIQGILTAHGTKELNAIFPEGSPFKYPKPTALIKMLLAQTTNDHDLVLDFFAGSGTTAQAVMELNEEDGGHRQFIGVQLPEATDTDSEAYKTGYQTIAQITKARIEKVIAQIAQARTADAAHVGKPLPVCQHYVLAPSNFKMWQSEASTPTDIARLLREHQSAQKAGSPPDALFVELCLKSGLGLHVAYTQTNGFYKTEIGVWFCFDTFSLAHQAAILAEKPQKVIMLNTCFESDAALANFREILQKNDIELSIV